jgi:hypothetical protein
VNLPVEVILVLLSVVVYVDVTLPAGVYPAFVDGTAVSETITAKFDADVVPVTETLPCVPVNVGFDTVPFGFIDTVPLSTYANAPRPLDDPNSCQIPGSVAD